MHADRWSSTAWVVALIANVVLLGYLAATVCLQPTWPRPGPRGTQLVRPGEIVCDEAYLDRQRAVEPLIERELERLNDEYNRTKSIKRRPGLAAHVEHATHRLEAVRSARAQCNELHAAIAARLEAEQAIRARDFDARVRAKARRGIPLR